jgi:hypothetical protein
MRFSLLKKRKKRGVLLVVKDTVCSFSDQYKFYVFIS